MATLNGKKLTQKELSALEKKWAKEDKAFWAKQKKEKIAREIAHISKLRKLPKTTLSTRLIQQHTNELKRLRASKN